MDDSGSFYFPVLVELCLAAAVFGFVLFWFSFRRLGEIEKRIAALEARAQSIEPAPGGLAVAPAAVVEQAAPHRKPPPVSAPPLIAPPLVSPKVAAPPRPAFNWEVFAGGRFLNLVGAVILLIGFGLFLQYAIDQNWISPGLRVAGGIFVGLAILGACEAFFKQRPLPWPAHGLIGLGLGVLYLSGYAAFDAYHLIPFAAAYGLMAAITIAAFLLARRYDSLGVSLVGWAGGFATPFIMYQGVSANEIGLASYVILLDLAIAATLIAKQRWLILQPLALAGSAIVATMWWRDNYPDVDSLAATIATLSLWLISFVLGVLRKRAVPPAYQWSDALGIYNVLQTIAGLGAILAAHKAALTGALLVMTVAYLASWLALRRFLPKAVALLRQQYFIAAALGLEAAGAQLSGLQLASTVLAVALAVATIEMLLRKRSAWRAVEQVAGSGLYVLAAVLLLCGIFFVSEWSGTPSPFAHEGSHWALGFGSIDFALLVALGACALPARWFRDGETRGFYGFVLRQASVLGLLALTALHFASFAYVGALGLEAALITWIALRTARGDLEVDALLLLGLGLLVMITQPDLVTPARLFTFVPVFNLRFLGLVLLAAGMGAVGLQLRFGKTTLPPAIPRILRATAALVAVAAVTLEVYTGFAIAIARAHNDFATTASALALLTNGQELAVSAVWIVASAVVMALGIALRVRDLRLMSIALFDLTILKAFFVDLGSLTAPYRIIAFIGLGLALLAVSGVYRRLEQGSFRSPGAAPLPS